MDKEGGSMDLQQRNWRKPLAGVVLLLLLLTEAWCVNDTPEPPVVLQKEPERNKAGQGPAEVKGLAEADNSKPLRNPFSLLHETEAEAGRLAAVPEEPALSGGKDTAKAAPPAPPVQAQPAKSKAVETPPSHECNYLIIHVITQPSRRTGAHFSTGRKK